MNLDIKIEKRPSIVVSGLKIRTNVNSNVRDCPALWKQFADLIDHNNVTSYGVTFNVDDEWCYDYIAGVEADSGKAQLPEMETITIPEGEYAICEVNGVTQLYQIHSYFLTLWSHPDYEFTLGVSYDLFPPEFASTSRFWTHIPVSRK